jgi:hypothetical protein
MVVLFQNQSGRGQYWMDGDLNCPDDNACPDDACTFIKKTAAMSAAVKCFVFFIFPVM